MTAIIFIFLGLLSIKKANAGLTQSVFLLPSGISAGTGFCALRSMPSKAAIIEGRTLISGGRADTERGGLEILIKINVYQSIVLTTSEW